MSSSTDIRTTGHSTSSGSGYGVLATGGIIQIVQSIFWLIMGALALFAASAAESIFRNMTSEDKENARIGLVAIGVVVVAVSVTTLVLAILALRRSNGCRIASGVLQVIFFALAVISAIMTILNRDVPTGAIFLALVSGVAMVSFLSSQAARATRA